MAFIGNLMARKAYLSQAKSMRANDASNYTEAIELEKKAEVNYEKALEKGMNQAGYLMAFTVLLLRTGKFERAMDIIRRTEKVAKLNVEQRRRLTMNYAICQWKLGELDRAIGSMRELMKNYKNSTIYGALGYMLIEKGIKTGDFTEAKAFNDEAIDYDDDDAVVLDNVAQYYLNVGDKEKAREYFVKALELRPKQVDSMYYLAKVKQSDGDIQGALELMDKALGIHFSALATITIEQMRALREELLAEQAK